ncbi:hypothetical protein ACOMHN_007097 [Nucella lapillus]
MDQPSDRGADYRVDTDAMSNSSSNTSNSSSSSSSSSSSRRSSSSRSAERAKQLQSVTFKLIFAVGLVVVISVSTAVGFYFSSRAMHEKEEKKPTAESHKHRFKQEKPGRCPVSNEMGITAYECSRDSECPNSMKCCTVGGRAGRVCREPVFVSPHPTPVRPSPRSTRQPCPGWYMVWNVASSICDASLRHAWDDGQDKCSHYGNFLKCASFIMLAMNYRCLESDIRDMALKHSSFFEKRLPDYNDHGHSSEDRTWRHPYSSDYSDGYAGRRSSRYLWDRHSSDYHDQWRSSWRHPGASRYPGHYGSKYPHGSSYPGYYGSDHWRGSTSDNYGSRWHSSSSPDYYGSRWHSSSSPDYYGSRWHSSSSPDYDGSRWHSSSSDYYGSRWHSSSSSDYNGSRWHSSSSSDYYGSRWHSSSSSDYYGSRWHSSSSSDYYGSRWHSSSSPDYYGSRWHSFSSPDYHGSRWHSSSSPDYYGSRWHSSSSPDYYGSRWHSSSSPDYYGSRHNSSSPGYYDYGESSSYYGSGESSSYYGSGESSSYYGSGESSSYYGSGESSPYYGSGESSPYYGSGESSPYYGSGESSPYYGSGESSAYYGSGESSAYYGSGEYGSYPTEENESDSSSASSGDSFGDDYLYDSSSASSGDSFGDDYLYPSSTNSWYGGASRHDYSSAMPGRVRRQIADRHSTAPPLLIACQSHMSVFMADMETTEPCANPDAYQYILQYVCTDYANTPASDSANHHQPSSNYDSASTSHHWPQHSITKRSVYEKKMFTHSPNSASRYACWQVRQKMRCIQVALKVGKLECPLSTIHSTIKKYSPNLLTREVQMCQASVQKLSGDRCFQAVITDRHPCLLKFNTIAKSPKPCSVFKSVVQSSIRKHHGKCGPRNTPSVIFQWLSAEHTLKNLSASIGIHLSEESKEKIFQCFSSTSSSGSIPVFKLVSDKPDTPYGYVKRTVDIRGAFVTSSFLDDKLADMLCKASGYSHGGIPFRSRLPDIPMGSHRWNIGFSCSLGDTTIEQCAGKGRWFYGDVRRVRDGLVNGFVPVKVFCFSSDVRLHNSLLNSTGMAQVLKTKTKPTIHHKEYQGICRDGFSNYTASLFCRALGLGFQYGMVLGYQPFRFNSDYNNYFSVYCNGTERKLSQCQNYTVTYERYRVCESGFAAVTCTPPLDTNDVPDMTVKLDVENQTVLVSQNNQWGYICNDRWTQTEADAVCKELNFDHGIVKEKWTTESTSRPFLVHSVRCVDADRWASCSYRQVDSNVCIGNSPARVHCYNNDSLPVYSLYNGKDAKPNYGRVHVTREHTEGRLCAAVDPKHFYKLLCRQLGYLDGQEYPGELPVRVTLPFWETRYDSCSGEKDTSLESCHNENWGRGETIMHTAMSDGTVYEDILHDCQYGDLKAFCYNKTVRVHSGFFNTSGVVEMAVSGTYRQVCAQTSTYTQQAADVLCHTLTHSKTSSAIMVRRNVFMFNARPTVHVNFSCQGSEEHADQCVTVLYNASSSDCEYSEKKVAVVCYEGQKPADGITEWMIGPQESVLVKQFGLWGHVCSATWGDNETAAVCRTLGYYSGVSMSSDAWGFNMAQWVDTMTCPAGAVSVSQCAVTMRNYTLPRGQDYTSCFACRAKCFNKEDVPTMFFVDSQQHSNRSRAQGRVAVTHQGTTGYFCSSSVTTRGNYDTLCRVMGYPRGGEQMNLTNDASPGTYSDAWSADLGCGQWDRAVHYVSCLFNWHRASVYEDRMHSDGYPYSGSGSGSNTLSWCGKHVPAVFCFKSEDYRLLSSSITKFQGLLLVWNEEKKAWEQVCSANFTSKEANAACRQLGYPRGGQLTSEGPKPAMTYNLGVRQFQCSGTAGETLSSCSTTDALCDEYKVVWLKCQI